MGHLHDVWMISHETFFFFFKKKELRMSSGGRREPSEALEHS